MLTFYVKNAVFCYICIAFILEIDRYIGLPIFFPIFKHFTIIGFVKKKYRFFFFFFFFFLIYIHNYTEYNQQ